MSVCVHVRVCVCVCVCVCVIICIFVEISNNSATLPTTTAMQYYAQVYSLDRNFLHCSKVYHQEEPMSTTKDTDSSRAPGTNNLVL